MRELSVVGLWAGCRLAGVLSSLVVIHCFFCFVFFLHLACKSYDFIVLKKSILSPPKKNIDSLPKYLSLA